MKETGAWLVRPSGAVFLACDTPSVSTHKVDSKKGVRACEVCFHPGSLIRAFMN